MRWSKLFIPTLRETPAEAEVVSHQLLLRAGYVRQLAAGLYSYLFLARRSLLKIERIIREEMDGIGAQEMFLPELHPADVWQKSGRWDAIGHDMFRLQDRWGRELCLGMTEEEVMTSIAVGELRSYKQLPQLWYQIQAKFRDEPRPKSGLMRVRRFTMKDSYSFDLNADGLDVSYKKHHAAYCRIFDRCGLNYIPVEAHSGAMGGSQSHEFSAPSDAGEDVIAICDGCGYAANLEKARSVARPPAQPDSTEELPPEEFHTPGKKTIAEVAEFDGAPDTSHIKSLVMAADGKPYLIVLRGDHSLNEAKLGSVIEAKEVRAAHAEEIREWFGADAGSLGPVDIMGLTILTDEALEGRRDLIAGANRDDYHLRHVMPGRDFEANFVDVREVAEGDACVDCGKPIALRKCIEIGHIFKLGYRYAESMGLRVLDPNGKEVTPIMGSYGIGLERILTAVIEQNHDDGGMMLPASIAPFEAIITPVNLKNDDQREAAEKLYEDCRRRGIDIVLDDRSERAGVKFSDAELVGIPYRLTVGRKVSDGIVELVVRSTRQTTDVRLEVASERLAELLQQAVDPSTSA
jgi:prolyl-tRNA synthetase